MGKGQWLLAVYSGAVSAILGVLVLHGLPHSNRPSFEQITVQRINIVEPDGTLRMVISNHAELPGIVVHGKEQAFARPQAGMLFYNDEGSENGGLIFGGHQNAKGEVEDSGGSLSFDKYGANEVEVVADLHHEPLATAHRKYVARLRELRAAQAPRTGATDMFDSLPCIRCARASGKLEWLTAHPSSAWSGAAAPPAPELAVF